MIDDSSTGRANKTLLNQVEITLNCTESKRVAPSATVCTDCQKTTLNFFFFFGVAPWFQEILGGSNLTQVLKRSRAIPQPKHWPPRVWLLFDFFGIYVHKKRISVCVFTCVCVLTPWCVSIEGYISEGQNRVQTSSQIWASDRHEMCLFLFFLFFFFGLVFVKSNFVA